MLLSDHGWRIQQSLNKIIEKIKDEHKTWIYLLHCIKIRPVSRLYLNLCLSLSLVRLYSKQPSTLANLTFTAQNTRQWFPFLIWAVLDRASDKSTNYCICQQQDGSTVWTLRHCSLCFTLWEWLRGQRHVLHWALARIWRFNNASHSAMRCSFRIGRQSCRASPLDIVADAPGENVKGPYTSQLQLGNITGLYLCYTDCAVK